MNSSFNDVDPIDYPLLINTKFDILQRWTNKQHTQIIFDSDVDTYTKKEFQNSTSDKKNLMFINITDSDEVFGCYCEKELSKTAYFIEDENFLNKELHSKRAHNREWWRDGFCFSKSPQFVYGCFNCFYIQTELGVGCYSEIQTNNKELYEDLVNDTDLVGKLSFNVVRVIVLEWW
ncbi:TLDc domain-containing protein [Entamoeba marina]